MRIFLSLILLLAASIGQAADFVGSVAASNATGRLVAPTNFFFGNLWAGTNVYLEKTNRTGYRIHVTPAADDSKQFGSANLTNWSNIPTGSMANVVSATFLTNWANSISNYVTAATNSASVTNWINSRQPASAALTNISGLADTTFTNVPLGGTNISVRNAAGTNFFDTTGNLNNWSQIPTGAMANVVSATFLTNWANAVSNLAETKQVGSATLTNLAATGAITNLNSGQFSGSAIWSIKSGVLVTNGMLYPSNVTGPALILNAVTGMGTNLFELRNTNGSVAAYANSNLYFFSSNLNAIASFALSNATASRLAVFDANKLLTNGALTEGDINAKQFGSANLTNWSLIPTGAMANVVATDFLTNWANSISNLTQTKQNGSAVLTNITATGAITNLNANQFGDITTIATIKNLARLTNINFWGATNNGDFTNVGNVYITGTLTNGGAVNMLGGVTNWIQSETKGTLYASSNLFIKAGQSTSNAWGGGIIYRSNAAFTNLNAAGTMSNLANVSIPGNTLTNAGDVVYARWGGIMPGATPNTNQFQIVFGSTTILDTGLQVASNTAFMAECWITRTGNTAQHVEGRLEWGPGGGIPFAFTNSNAETVETNGIATVLALKGGSRRVGAHTNNSLRVYYEPGPN